jgi:hypothetical protein
MSGVNSLLLVPLQSGDDEGAVMAALLESLARMVSRNHRPSSCLLVRLTDGRVKMVASPGGSRQAREEALRIRNEYGPLSVAFSIEVADGPHGVRLTVENLDRRGPVRMEQHCGSACRQVAPKPTPAAFSRSFPLFI